MCFLHLVQFNSQLLTHAKHAILMFPVNIILKPITGMSLADQPVVSVSTFARRLFFLSYMQSGFRLIKIHYNAPPPPLPRSNYPVKSTRTYTQQLCTNQCLPNE